MINALEVRLALTDERLALAQLQLRRQEQELHRITHSIVWLMVLPFRWASGQWRLLREQGVHTRCRAISARLRSAWRRRTGR